MSFIFGGARGREDPELKAANRRFQEHLARDINDERTLAASSDQPIRRGRHWLWFAAAVVALTVLVLVNRGGTDVPITADCAHPALAVASSQVTAGDALRYRLTGPDHTRFVVTLDGSPVRGDAGSLVSYDQTQGGPALQLQQCLSPTLTVAAPAGKGPHRLAMLRVAGDGTTTEVARVTVQVTPAR